MILWRKFQGISPDQVQFRGFTITFPSEEELALVNAEFCEFTGILVSDGCVLGLELFRRVKLGEFFRKMFAGLFLLLRRRMGSSWRCEITAAALALATLGAFVGLSSLGLVMNPP